MRVKLVALLALAALAGCSGMPAPTAKMGQKGLVDRAQVACNAAEKGLSDLFTVEWDATRVSQFEAIATRDTVVVHFEGCNLAIIEGCNDDRIPGKLGAYGSPLFTSGAEKELVIRNRDELHAELPLGVATLGGRVESGEVLKLKYFVTGVGKTSRANLYESDLAKIPECAGASHFVSSYELGAFALETSSDLTAAANASVAGVGGGGGSTQRSEASLAHAGTIASCASHAKEGCRVPIRLHLKKIRKGEAPADTPASAVETSMGPSASDDFFAWHDKLLKLRGEATEKLRAGDGAACLRTLEVDMQLKERIARNDSHRVAYLLGRSGLRQMESECLAASGKCDAAVKARIDAGRLTEELQAAMGYRTAPKPDADIEKQAKQDLLKWCPQFK